MKGTEILVLIVFILGTIFFLLGCIVDEKDLKESFFTISFALSLGSGICGTWFIKDVKSDDNPTPPPIVETEYNYCPNCGFELKGE